MGELLKGKTDGFGLLLLEDQSSLLDEMTDCAESAGFVVYPARSLERALIHLRDHKDNIDAAIVDVMVPAEEVGVRRLDEELNKRETIIVKATDHGENLRLDVRALISLREGLTAQDYRIAKVVDSVGGITLLSHLEKEFGSIFLQKRLVVASARDPDGDDVVAAKNRLLQCTQLAWELKPLSPSRLDTLLESLITEIQRA